MSVVDRAPICAWLAEGATVVTPNRRLARVLKQDFDRGQQAAGRRVWPAADVLPWDAWLARSYGEAAGADAPALLSPLQQQALWEQVLDEARAAQMLQHRRALAATAVQAWDLAQQHDALPQLIRFAAAAASDDQAAFAGWAQAYARRLRALHALTTAQLPGWLAERLRAGAWRPAAPLVFAGFDAPLTADAAPDALPLPQAGLAATLLEAGVAVHRARCAAAGTTAPTRIECADAADQWRRIAGWACARLQADPQARIGIVLPDLGAQREALRQALIDALAPARRVLPDQDAPLPFNLSLGLPLAQQPLVATALAAAELLAQPLPLAAAGHLLRSPFLAGGGVGEAEWERRARLDRRLRADGVVTLTRERLRRAAGRLDGDGAAHGDGAPLLATLLDRAGRRLDAAPRRQLPSAWAALLWTLLADLGFPGTRGLDSVEYQCLQRWRALVAELGTLDAVLGPLSFAAALARLRAAALDTLFQPESAEAPVQVLGVLEAAHLQFDHLWVADLSDTLWPSPADPNPLLPFALQRAWGLPQASAELAAAQAAGRMAGWRAAAAELVYSHGLLDGDRPALPSPLTAALPATVAQAVAAPLPSVAARLAADAPALTALVDAQAPPLAPAAAALAGGTRVFTDQSACAFRAFAAHRLHARPLESPQPGLDPALRGGLLHATLEAFWKDLPSQATLQALDPAARAARAAAAARQALDALAQRDPDRLGPRLRALEQTRLQRAVAAWLEIEAARPPFEVLTVEAQGEYAMAGLRIALRPDRVDRLADGSLAVLDYKTGRVTTGAWLDARPDDPQLPLYATAYVDGALTGAPERVGALAFASLRPEAARLLAVAAADGLLPADRGVMVVGADQAPIERPGWDGLLADWRDALLRLAQAFVAGDAAVAPKSLNRSCQYCPLPLLCRIDERAALGARLAAAEGAVPDDGADDD